MEEWKTVVGYDEYEVSSYGRVRSKDRTYVDSLGRTYHKQGQIIKLEHQVSKNGYVQVMVGISSKRKMHRLIVARLVASAFLQNPNNLPQVNHKDENTTNNHVDNLEWCSEIYNVNYGTGIQRRSISKKRKINVYNCNHELIDTVDSGIEASKKYGVSRGHISTSCHNHMMAKGLYFEFV